MDKEQYEADKESGEIVDDQKDMPLNDYLDKRVAEMRSSEEAQRMEDERRQQIEDVKRRAMETKTVQMGTAEAPVVADIVATSSDGVMVRYNDTEEFLSWASVAEKMGTPISVKTDAEIEADLAEMNDKADERVEKYKGIVAGTQMTARVDLGDGQYEETTFRYDSCANEDGIVIFFGKDENDVSVSFAEDSIVDLDKAVNDSGVNLDEAPKEGDRVTYTAEDGSSVKGVLSVADDGSGKAVVRRDDNVDAVVNADDIRADEAPVDETPDVPKDFNGNPIPLKDNGEVDQKAFWNDNPEGWTRWNDEKRKDGGKNSAAYVQTALRSITSEREKKQKQYDSETDFDKRDALEQDLAGMDERIAVLNALADNYARRAEETAEEQAPVEETPAESPAEAPAETAPVAEEKPTADAEIPLHEQVGFESKEALEASIDEEAAASQTPLTADEEVARVEAMADEIYNGQDNERETEHDVHPDAEGVPQVSGTGREVAEAGVAESAREGEGVRGSDRIADEGRNTADLRAEGNEVSGNAVPVDNVQGNDALSAERESAAEPGGLAGAEGARVVDEAAGVQGAEQNAPAEAGAEGGVEVSDDVRTQYSKQEQRDRQDEAIGVVTGRTKEQVKTERQKRRIRKRADKWKKLLGDTFQILESEEDIDRSDMSEARKAEMKQAVTGDAKAAGWYFTGTGKAYLYLPNIKNEGEVDMKVLHEVLSHKGLRGLLGDKAFDAVCDSVWEQMSEQNRAWALGYVNGKASSVSDRRAAADEYIAHVVEEREELKQNEGTWKKIVARVKEILNDMLGEDRFSVSDRKEDDIDRLIQLSMARYIKEKNGDVVTEQNGDIRFSQATYKPYTDELGSYHEGTRAGVISYLESNGFDKAQIDDFVANMDYWYDFTSNISNLVNEDGSFKFKAFHEWSQKLPSYKRYEDKIVRAISSLVTNGDYPLNFELSTDCIKREAFTQVMDEMLALDNSFWQKLTPGNIIEIQNIQKAFGIQVACPLCFVEAKRLNILTWATSVAEKWNNALKAVEPDVEHTPFNLYQKGDATVDDVERKDGIVSISPLIKREIDAINEILGNRKNINDADLRRLTRGAKAADALLQEWIEAYKSEHDGDMSGFSLTKKQIGDLIKIRNGNIKSAEGRMKRVIAAHPEVRHTLSPMDLLGSAGLVRLRQMSGAGFADMFSCIVSANGTGTPKIVQRAEPYSGEIIDVSQAAFDSAASIGGARLFSFSDFDITKVFDIMQIMWDRAARNAKVQSYSKEVPYIILFGTSGVKINMSMLPEARPSKAAVDEYKKASNKRKEEIKHEVRENVGLEIGENGEILGFHLSDSHSVSEEFAKWVFHNPAYNANCGAIMVGIGVNHSIYAMMQPYIRMVIPFHRSGMPVAAQEKGDTMWYQDNTSMQNTGVMRGGKRVKILDSKGNSKVKGVDGEFNVYEGEELEDWDIRQRCRDYIAWCKEHKLEPKFPWAVNADGYIKWMTDNGYQPRQDFVDAMRANETDGVWNEYYKVITDFTAYQPEFDADGNMVAEKSARHLPVTGRFNTSPDAIRTAFGTDTSGAEVVSEESMLENRERSIENANNHAKEVAALSIQMLNSGKKAVDMVGESSNRFNNRSDSDLFLREQELPEQKQSKANKAEEVKERLGLPVEGETRYSFAGVTGALTLDKANLESVRMDNLETAKAMAETGSTPKEIKMATGWEKGKDDKWRYEIGDAKIKDGVFGIINSTKREGIRPALMDILEPESEVLQAYPQLKYVIVTDNTIKGEYGSANRGAKTINLSKGEIEKSSDPVKTLKQTINHEIQHFIQGYEGFAVGGSSSVNPKNSESLAKAQAENPTLYNFLYYFGKAPAGNLINAGASSLRGQLANYVTTRNIVGEDLARAKQIARELAHMDSYELGKLVRESKALLKKAKKEANDNYKRLAGEVEARNVGVRMPLNAEQRRQLTAEETEDVAREEQVVRFSKVTDRDLIARLDSEPKIRVYRSAQFIPDPNGNVEFDLGDGNGLQKGFLYAPMSAKVDGKWRDPISIGEWEQADENPELANDNGEFVLDKGNGDKLTVAYAPYLHTRRSPLNEQFSGAYERGNLVILESEIPESELTSGYTAEKSKKSTGEHDWPSGKVSNALAKEGMDTRKVILSRWAKPIRVVPNSEVADMISGLIGDRKLSFPYNVVTPGLRRELQSRGVKFSGWQGNKPKNVNEIIAGIKEESGEEVRFSKEAAREILDNYTDQNGEDKPWMSEEDVISQIEERLPYGANTEKLYSLIDRYRRLQEEDFNEGKRDFSGGEADDVFNQILDELESLSGEEVRFSKEDNDKLFGLAKERFGTTRDIREAGYVLPDGTMLDFSGRHWASGGDTSYLNGDRQVDHRDIADLEFERDMNTPTGIETSMEDFISRGAIRIDAKSGLINLSVKPTKAQTDVLRNLIRRNRNNMWVEFGDGNRSNGYAEYNYANEERVLGDINDYFDYGIKPEGDRYVRFSKANNNQRVFISNAEAALDGIQMEKATPEQWLKMLEGKGGLKAGEDKWIGLSDWIREQDRKTITKQEIADYIAQNQIRIEEVDYAERDNIKPDAEAEELAGAYSLDVNGFNDDVYIDGVANMYNAIDLYNRSNEDKIPEPEDPSDVSDEDYKKLIRFGESLLERLQEKGMGGVREINFTRLGYTTEGLDKKREIALTVPTIDPYNESDKIHFGDAGEGRAVAWIRFGETTVSAAEGEAYDAYQKANEEYQAYRQEIINKYALKATGTQSVLDLATEEENKKARGLMMEMLAKKQEWKKGNHKRERVLVIDEIQSKRHQDAREEGYQVPIGGETVGEYHDEGYGNSFAPIYNRAGGRIGTMHQQPDGWWSESEDGRFMSSTRSTEADALAVLVRVRTDKGIPAAPFEKNWHELAMKRMLRLAAEEGYDYVAWTTGEQQAERYNIGGILDSIRVRPIDGIHEPENPHREVMLSMKDGRKLFLNVDKDGKDVGGDFKGNNLSDVVGKELAERIMSSEGKETTIQGDGLRVGGEGMKGFYDQILPRFMDKYGKKWGVKTEDISLPNLEESARTMHAVPVTEAMKESVMEGQVMFSKRMDEDYMKAVESGDMKLAGEMVEEAARADGYNSPKLYHGTRAFGFTKIDVSAGDDKISFWASNNPKVSGTYAPYGEVRQISKELTYDDVEKLEAKKEKDLEDAIRDFRYKIDKYFSEWFFGPGGDSVIRDILYKTPDEDVYDKLVDLVADAWYQYGDDYKNDYESFADWQIAETKEWNDLEESIVDLESKISSMNELDALGEDAGGIYELYANTDNMFVVDGKGANWNNLRPEGLPKLEKPWSKDAPYKTRDVVKWANKNGYSGVIFKNIRDNGRYGLAEVSDVYAFFFPASQVKSADPVTYDDEGKVIPLSERFNTASEDIRFSKLSPVSDALNSSGISLGNPDVMKEYHLSALDLSKHGDVVTLSRIVAEKPGDGEGSRFMEDLAGLADQNGWTLALTPDDSFGATSVSRLKKFYKRFGFKENKGRNTDYSINESMIRRPAGDNGESALTHQKANANAVASVDRDGIAGLVGAENELDFYKGIVYALPAELRSGIMDIARQNGFDIKAAAKEYIAAKAGMGFENDHTGELRLFSDILRYYSENGELLDDATARYALWKNGQEGGIMTDLASAANKQRWGVGKEGEVRFSKGDLSRDIASTRTEISDVADDADAGLKLAKEIAKKTAATGSLLSVTRAMAGQRAYDKQTVELLTKAARQLLKEQEIDKMSRAEVARLLGIVNAANGKSPAAVKKYGDALVDAIVKHLVRTEGQLLGDLLKIKAGKVNASGVEVQGVLDVHGQNILKAMKAGMMMKYAEPGQEVKEKDGTIQGAILALDERMNSADEAVRKDADDKYEGYMLAEEYLRNIRESQLEAESLDEDLEEMEAKHKAGQMSDRVFREYKASNADAKRENQIELVESYRTLREKMIQLISGSKNAAREFREREQERKDAIRHFANSDLQGKDASTHRQEGRVDRLANSAVARFLAAPLATFDQMLRLFGEKSVDGKGYLWSYFMGKWNEATSNAYTGQRDAKDELDKKVSEVFGRDMIWSDLYQVERGMPKATVKWWDGGEMKEHELTQGNLLYIVMVDKMADGRMKLRRMGISEEDVKAIERQLDPRFLELAKWVQEDFLAGKRNKYNAIHERLFGASMAAIDNYFPLRINKRGLHVEEDISKADQNGQMNSTTTGAIVKRKRNSNELDLLNTDAFSVVIEHVDEMEQWAAFAEFNKDINTLLSDKGFRNKVTNMASVYGAGQKLWDSFKKVCQIAGNQYKPKVGEIDKAAVNIAKGVTAAKISFRVYTALKQFLSFPAFLTDANPAYLAKSVATPWKSWEWAMENLPIFEKRWKSRIAGDTRLMNTESDWKLFHNQMVEKLAKWGMSPNAFVDAVTVSIGAKAIYDTKYNRYIKEGYTEEQADKKAKQDATVLYNETQQSSESAFTSAIQVERTALATALSVFRNSSMGYQRQLHDALRNIGKYLKKGYREESIEFMTKQMVREGIPEDQARANAEKRYNREKWRSFARVANFGFVVQFAWNLGSSIAYLLFGDDDDEKDKMLKEAALKALYGGWGEGLAGGNVISEYLNKKFVTKENLYSFSPSLMPVVSDMKNLLQKMSSDQFEGWNDVFFLGAQALTGVNPQTFTDTIAAIVDACNGDLDTSKEVMILIMRILQVPQSQIDKIYIDELGIGADEAKKLPYEEIAERYAKYKVNREAPLRMVIPDDAKEEQIGKKEKTFKKKVTEREELHNPKEE